MAIVSQPTAADARTERGESHPFTEAAAYLREQAPEIATGSRDFGRGFMLAAHLLETAAGR